MLRTYNFAEVRLQAEHHISDVLARSATTYVTSLHFFNIFRSTCLEFEENREHGHLFFFSFLFWDEMSRKSE